MGCHWGPLGLPGGAHCSPMVPQCAHKCPQVVPLWPPWCPMWPPCGPHVSPCGPHVVPIWRPMCPMWTPCVPMWPPCGHHLAPNVPHVAPMATQWWPHCGKKGRKKPRVFHFGQSLLFATLQQQSSITSGIGVLVLKLLFWLPKSIPKLPQCSPMAPSVSPMAPWNSPMAPNGCQGVARRENLGFPMENLNFMVLQRDTERVYMCLLNRHRLPMSLFNRHRHTLSVCLSKSWKSLFSLGKPIFS